MKHVLFTLLMAVAAGAADSVEQAKIDTAVAALTRLQDVNLEEKPAIKAAVARVLERTRGTPNFVKLVQHFKLTNQNPGLLEVAVNNPANDFGVEAVRLVLAGNDLSLVRKALKTTNAANAGRLVEVLGKAKDQRAVPLLAPLITHEAHDSEKRRAAVRALTQTQDGAAALLALARQDELPAHLKLLTATELNAVRWPEIRREAATVLPLPALQNAEPLPPITDLIKMKGNAAKGAEVYRRETAGCINCHQVRGEGREVGPALTEIGSKLPKEALYEAILDPGAGISFGFEAWQVELKSGDEAYGLKVSETADALAIKDTGGIVTRYPKTAIASLQQMKSSIMPSGLQQTLNVQELVDLIEYLASLRTPSGP